eukprot:jgi/Chlat1/172/Chrsp1S03238
MAASAAVPLAALVGRPPTQVVRASGCVVSSSSRRSTALPPSAWKPQSQAGLLARKGQRPGRLRACSAGLAGFSDESGEDGGDSPDWSAEAQRLNSLLRPSSINGTELRQLVKEKYGRSYDVRLCKFSGVFYLQIMWRFLEQKSFPLTEQRYQDQLDAVAEYITEWGLADKVRETIINTKERPRVNAGNAKAVSIRLDVAHGSSGRGSEWDDCF